MTPFAYFGIQSSGLTLAVDLLILFVVVLYLSLIYWTYADARRRIADPALIGCATLAAFFPFVGPIVYIVLRPPEYLEDVRERELEMQAAEARLYQLDFGLCPHCDYQIERDFIRCPSCLRKLKDRCVNCAKPLDRAWTICPYCETEVPASTSRRTRRRRTALDSEPAIPDTSDDAPAVVDSPRSRAATRAPTEAPVSKPRGSDPVPVPSKPASRSRSPVRTPPPPEEPEPSPRPRSTARAGRHGGHPHSST